MGAVKEPLSDRWERPPVTPGKTLHRPVDLRWRADLDDLALRGLLALAAAVSVPLVWWLLGPDDWSTRHADFRCWWMGLPTLSMLGSTSTQRWTGGRLPVGLAWVHSAWHSTWSCMALYALGAALHLQLPGPWLLLSLWLLPPTLAMTGFRAWSAWRKRWAPRMNVVLAGTAQGLQGLRVHAQQHRGLNVIGEALLSQRSPLSAAHPAAEPAATCDGVLISPEGMSGTDWQRHAQMWRQLTPNVYVCTDAFWATHTLAQPSRRGPEGTWSLGPESLPLSGRLGKRLFDIVFSGLALTAFLPAGLVIALAIQLESPGPVFFVQPRCGRHGRTFPLVKFRSMRHDPSPQEIRLTERGDARVTRVGDFLRRTSLDEFPQFVNVLLGHMSVVGPRPHPPGVKAGQRTYEEVIPHFMARYQVRPGLTGWAQVHGLRGNTFTEQDIVERFEKDIEYIQRWSWPLDLLIILRTVLGGFGGRNAF